MHGVMLNNLKIRIVSLTGFTLGYEATNVFPWTEAWVFSCFSVSKCKGNYVATTSSYWLIKVFIMHIYLAI